MSDLYYQVEVALKKQDEISYQELIVKACEDFSCDGIEEFSMNEKEVDLALGEKAYSGGDLPLNVLNEVDDLYENKDGRKVLFLFCHKGSETNANAFCLFMDENKIDYSRIEKDVLDWNSEWRKHYSQIEISKNLKIIPSWKKVENSENEVYIYPGMGFGTGGHETTFLCLKHFEDIKSEAHTQKICLDFGCGSGILGIAAIKRAGYLVDFCDIDKNALDNCQQNLLLNFEGQSLEGNSLVSRTNFQIEKTYDLVFANILEDILIAEKELLLESLSSDGHLIISGILINQIESIKKHYSSLELVNSYEKGDWASILFLKK